MNQKLNLIRVKHELGCCYATCVELLLTNTFNYPDMKLVHGYPRLSAGPNKGKLFGHAWLEIELEGLTFAIDPKYQRHPFNKDAYYMKGQIDEKFCTRYTVTEVIEYLDKKGHYGPWVDSCPEALFK